MPASQWNWSQLIDPINFKWIDGVSPLSDLKYVFIAWGCYFTAILSLKVYMQSREPFKLKWVSAIHNWILCIWSLGMFAGAVYSLIERGMTHGAGEMFCTNDMESISPIMQYTMYIYYVSKYYELLDTVILIMKKKPLILLHWYHHAIVVFTVRLWVHYGLVGFCFAVMTNTFVHIFMYYYYYAASIGIDCWWKKYITSGQIVQFMVNFSCAVPFAFMNATSGCGATVPFYFSLLVNLTFLILFIDFYRRSYTSKKGGGKRVSDKKASSSSSSSNAKKEE